MIRECPDALHGKFIITRVENGYSIEYALKKRLLEE